MMRKEHHTVKCNSFSQVIEMWGNVFLYEAFCALTWRGRWLDVDWRWFDHRQHSGLQGLDDDGLGLQGSCCRGQRHGCNQRLGLDGNFWADLNWPLDWLSWFGWCVYGCMSWDEDGRSKIRKQDLLYFTQRQSDFELQWRYSNLNLTVQGILKMLCFWQIHPLIFRWKRTFISVCFPNPIILQTQTVVQNFPRIFEQREQI